MENISPNSPILESFDQWKQFLSERVNEAKASGASESTIASAATGIGSFLSQKVDPRNREQRLLKELWDVGTQQEQHALASMITKMVSDGKVH